MMQIMRTTVDLPPVVHQRVREIAAERDLSVSAVVADLTARGLASMGNPTPFQIDPVSKFPMISIGRPVTAVEVAELLDDE